MKTEIVHSLITTFEGHAQQTDGGVEYWLARDLQHLLGYAEWRNFNSTVISKAKTACELSGHAVSDHFVDVNKMVDLGSGSQREVDDLMLTRYACYRKKLTETEKDLSQVIYEQTGGNQDFALIRSKGDNALFNKSTQAMKAQWKVPDSRPLADFAPTIILKARDFAAEITIFNARQHQMTTETAISKEHIANNRAVRDTLLERGIRPESLPPAEDVKKVERRLAADDRKAIKKPDALDS
jgi:DNA-damage-inducible protein D